MAGREAAAGGLLQSGDDSSGWISGFREEEEEVKVCCKPICTLSEQPAGSQLETG